MCLTVCFYFPIGILGQVWYLIVSIPDLCTLTYFVTSSCGHPRQFELPHDYVWKHKCLTPWAPHCPKVPPLGAWPRWQWKSRLICFVSFICKKTHTQFGIKVFEIDFVIEIKWCLTFWPLSRAPGAGPKKNLPLHSPFMRVTHSQIFGWISFNGLGGDSITDRQTDGRREAITISPSLFKKCGDKTDTKCCITKQGRAQNTTSIVSKISNELATLRTDSSQRYHGTHRTTGCFDDRLLTKMTDMGFYVPWRVGYNFRLANFLKKPSGNLWWMSTLVSVERS